MKPIICLGEKVAMLVKRYKNSAIIPFILLFIFNYSAIGAALREKDKKEILNKVYTLKIPFIENKGQIKDESVRYYAKTFGGTVFVTKDGKLVYSLPKFEEKEKVKGWAIRESLVGASISNIKGEEKAVTKVSYFKGKGPSKWRRNISTYNLVSLGEVYKGIEVKVKAYGKNIEKLFYVKAGADPESIKIKIEGAKSLKINEAGELEVETGLGVIKFTKPVAYQEINGKRVEVAASYTLLSNTQYGFNVGNYNKKDTLIIDPLLASTFIGGSDLGVGNSIALDKDGNVYITGYTWSSDYPTTLGAYDESYNGWGDIFVSKLDSNLSNLLASTFIGGSNDDCGESIALDKDGNVYVSGWTWSSDYPTTPGAYDESFNGPDVFISKLDSSLSSLLASTFIGGSDLDKGYSIALDKDGNVYITGGTGASDYPTTSGAYDESFNGWCDVFVSKLDSNLSNLLASTFIGGSSQDWGESIALDGDGNVYITGETESSDYPTTLGAYDETYDFLGDVFVSKLDSNLSNLLASTFIGGNSDERGYSIALGRDGNVYITGWTWSSDYPTTPGAYDESYYSRYDLFVSKLDSNLSTLLASTFIGGSSEDRGFSIALDEDGNVYVTGRTCSPEYPTTSGAYDERFNGYCDVFVSKLDNNLSAETEVFNISVSDSPDPFNPLYETNTITITNETNTICSELTLSIEGIGRIWEWENLAPGESIQATWDGRNNEGSIVPTGTYAYQVAISGQTVKIGTITVLSSEEKIWSKEIVDLRGDAPKGYDIVKVSLLHDGDDVLAALTPEGFYADHVFGAKIELAGPLATQPYSGVGMRIVANDTVYFLAYCNTPDYQGTYLFVSYDGGQSWQEAEGNYSGYIYSTHGITDEKTILLAIKMEDIGSLPWTVDFLSGIVYTPAEYEIKDQTEPVEVVPPDTDNDGLPDSWEKQYFGNLDQGPDEDYDQDGMSNKEEWERRSEFSAPLDPTNPDQDSDAVRDGDEVHGIVIKGIRYKSDPTKEDTDGDSFTDYEEYWICQTDPCEPNGDENTRKLKVAIENLHDAVKEYMSWTAKTAAGIAAEGLKLLTDEKYKVGDWFIRATEKFFTNPEDVKAVLEELKRVEVVSKECDVNSVFGIMLKNFGAALGEESLATYVKESIKQLLTERHTKAEQIYMDLYPKELSNAVDEDYHNCIRHLATKPVPSDYPIDAVIKELQRSVEAIKSHTPFEMQLKKEGKLVWSVPGSCAPLENPYNPMIFGTANSAIKSYKTSIKDFYSIADVSFGKITKYRDWVCGTTSVLKVISLLSGNGLVETMLLKPIATCTLSGYGIQAMRTLTWLNKHFLVPETWQFLGEVESDMIGVKYWYQNVTNILTDTFENRTCSTDISIDTLDIEDAHIDKIEELSMVEGKARLRLKNNDPFRNAKVKIALTIKHPFVCPIEGACGPRSDQEVDFVESGLIDLEPGTEKEIEISFVVPVYLTSLLHQEIFKVEYFALTSGGVIDNLQGKTFRVCGLFCKFEEYLQQVSDQTIEQGEEVVNTFSTDGSERRIQVSMEHLGSDVDLHLYDQSGRHVGLNYDTGEVETEIPGSWYSGPSSNPEIIIIDFPEAQEFTTRVVGVSVPVEEPFTVWVYHETEHPANLMAIPKEVSIRTEGDPGIALITLSEGGGHHGITGINATVTPLMGTNDIIGAEYIDIDLPTTHLAPGESITCEIRITIPPDIVSGRYEGMLTFSSSANDISIPIVVTYKSEETVLGDLDGDSDVDQDDLNILLTYRNQPASACPECDIDGDGVITVLDARKLVLMCTRPRCATEPE